MAADKDFEALILPPSKKRFDNFSGKMKTFLYSFYLYMKYNLTLEIPADSRIYVKISPNNLALPTFIPEPVSSN